MVAFPVILKIFSAFGQKKKISAFQVHAEVEFELLEGAVLALKTLNGLSVKGQPIKVGLLYFSLHSTHPLHPLLTSL